MRLGLEFTSFPLTPTLSPKERESSWTALENSDVAVAVPATLFISSEAHDNQARSYYQSTDECFSLSLRERAKVRGNSTPAVSIASALDPALEDRPKSHMALRRLSFGAFSFGAGR